MPAQRQRGTDLAADARADTPPERLTSKTSWLLTQSAAQARCLVAEALAQATAATTTYQYPVLATLEECGPASQVSLSQRCDVHPSDMVSAVDDLERCGFVLRAPDTIDRRRHVVSITSAGRRQLDKLDRLLADAQSSFLDPLSPAEQAQLVTLLQRLHAHHRQPHGGRRTVTRKRAAG